MKNVRFLVLAAVSLLVFAATYVHADTLYTTNLRGNITVMDSTDLSTISTISSGAENAAGIAIDSAGNIYVGDRSSEQILKISTSGTTSSFSSGLGTIQGLAFDSVGNLFVSSSVNGAGTIWKIDSTGLKSTFSTSGLSSPRGLGFGVDGYLYVVNRAGNSISRYDITDPTNPYTFTPSIEVDGESVNALSNPFGIAFDAAGNIYVSNNNESGSIVKIHSDGTTETIISDLSSPTGLTIDSEGNLYVVVGNSVVKYSVNEDGSFNIDSTNSDLTSTGQYIVAAAAPEPTTWVLMGFGLVLLVAASRKRLPICRTQGDS